MPSGFLRIFDARRVVQLQGFSGRGAATTIPDARKLEVPGHKRIDIDYGEPIHRIIA